MSSDQQIQSRFSSLQIAYSSTTSDSLPDVPAGWSSENPSPDALNTPFGTLWQEVHNSVDPNSQGSVVFEMNRIADLLGFTTATGLTEPPVVYAPRLR
jgi:hypothetical protein